MSRSTFLIREIGVESDKKNWLTLYFWQIFEAKSWVDRTFWQLKVEAEVVWHNCTDLCNPSHWDFKHCRVTKRSPEPSIKHEAVHPVNIFHCVHCLGPRSFLGPHSSSWKVAESQLNFWNGSFIGYASFGNTEIDHCESLSKRTWQKTGKWVFSKKVKLMILLFVLTSEAV